MPGGCISERGTFQEPKEAAFPGSPGDESGERGKGSDLAQRHVR